jgi:hypothetical protein
MTAEGFRDRYSALIFDRNDAAAFVSASPLTLHRLHQIVDTFYAINRIPVLAGRLDAVRIF